MPTLSQLLGVRVQESREALIGWLIIKLIDWVFGEFAILKPFEYAGGVGEDLAYLWEEWRDLRRERREREQREREYARQQDAEIARRRRQETAEKVLSGPAAAAKARSTPEDIPKADEV